MPDDTPAPVAQPLSVEEASLALSALEQAIDSSLPRSMNITITKGLGKALANAVSLYLSGVPRAMSPTVAIGNDPNGADADVGQPDLQPFGAGLGDMVGPSSVESPGPSHATPVGAGHGPLASVPNGEAALGASSRFHDASVTLGVNRLDAARSVPSDRPASGLTDPDNALREALTRHYWNTHTGECGCGESFNYHAQWVDHIATLDAARSVPDNAALREVIDAAWDEVLTVGGRKERERLRAALIAAAPASPSGSSPVAAGLDVEPADVPRIGGAFEQGPEIDDSPTGLPKCHKCGNTTFRPDSYGFRREARRCTGCQRVTGRCTCADPEEAGR